MRRLNILQRNKITGILSLGLGFWNKAENKKIYNRELSKTLVFFICPWNLTQSWNILRVYDSTMHTNFISTKIQFALSKSVENISRRNLMSNTFEVVGFSICFLGQMLQKNVKNIDVNMLKSYASWSFL